MSLLRSSNPDAPINYDYGRLPTPPPSDCPHLHLCTRCCSTVSVAATQSSSLPSNAAAAGTAPHPVSVCFPHLTSVSTSDLRQQLWFPKIVFATEVELLASVSCILHMCQDLVFSQRKQGFASTLLC